MKWISFLIVPHPAYGKLQLRDGIVIKLHRLRIVIKLPDKRV